MVTSKARRNLIARQSGEHCHEYSQILFGWRGQMECEFHKESGQLSNGTVAIIPEHTAHLFSGLNDDCELLVIDLALSDPYIQALEQACNTSFKDTLFQQPEFVSLNSEILPLLDFAAKQLLSTKDQLNPQLNCQLVSLFMTQLCQMSAPNLTLSLTHNRLDIARLNDFIDQRLSNPPSNSELANALYVSESHFYCLCQSQLGMTPQQYLMSRRMQRANFLLTNSKITLAILAAELGFADASSFSRSYKKYYHKTPSHARRLLGL
ncbi:AraC family transcriptional regulator [Neptunomonas japonica]|uniref:AraC family transcriptional regulator n=1 Tax=Neptunomonas japonica JAMM 1380 TaxID=1441457 RepID=A0A7R6PFB6_9GAMM|nr:AraC family transcriptional regulator [Neptunomonas japonica]BBB28101.1 AraC family transcriptional regulator [Neptunomonas japonica JAMM 1380]